MALDDAEGIGLLGGLLDSGADSVIVVKGADHALDSVLSTGSPPPVAVDGARWSPAA